jgi:adenosylcobinamide-phosphate synthase
MDGYSTWVLLPVAFALDLVLGDPRLLPHPVRWMGKAIEVVEPHFRKIPVDLSASGALFAASLVFCTWSATFLLLAAANAMHPGLKRCLEIILIYYCISAGSLETAAMEIYRYLQQKNVEKAGEKLALIVGRDVANYKERDISRATVETVAENLVDGVISPLFFAAIGGAPLAMVYKMVNTLDSMVGYKNEKYFYFGKAAARCDDILNYIPARFSVPVISLASQILCGKGWRSLKTAFREGAHHSSPNAGYPEAAFAGALAVKLNGPNYYQGKLVEKPYIGVSFGSTTVQHIKKACDIMMFSSLLWLLIVSGISVFLISR